MAEREIIYRLKLEADQANQRVLDEFRRASEQVDSAVNRSRQQSAQQQSESMRRAVQQAASGYESIRDAGVRAHQSVAAAAERASQQLERSLRRQSEQAQREYEGSISRLRGARAAMADTLNATAEGTLKLGRGFVALGLVGEENTQKIIDTLLTLRGTFDLILGGIQVYRQLTRAVEAYRTAVQAAAAAEAAAASIRALGAGAAGRAAAGAAGGAAGSAVAGAAGGAVGAGGTALFSGSALALGGAAAGIGLLYGAGYLANRFGAADIQSQTRSQQEQFAAFQSQRERQLAFEAADRDAANLRARSGVGRRLGAIDARVRLAGSDQDRLSAIQEGLGATSTALGAARGREDQEAVAELLERQIDLTEQRATVERSIIQDRRRANQEALRDAERELGVVQQRLKAEREKVDSSRESFGLLDERQQARLIAIQQRGAAGGELTVDELRELQSVGLGSSSSIVRRQATARAEAAARRAGGTFAGIFGSEESGRIAELEGREREIKVSVEGRRKLEIEIKRDEDRLIDATTAEVARLLEQRDAELERRLETEIERRFRELALRDNQRRAGTAASARGGR